MLISGTARRGEGIEARNRRWWPPVRGVRAGRKRRRGQPRGHGSWWCCRSRGSCGSPERSNRAQPAGRRTWPRVGPECSPGPDSLKRLPLSCAITRPRRKASSARTGIGVADRRSRRRTARTRATKGLPVASAASTRPFAAATRLNRGTGDRQCEDQACPGDVYGCRDRVRVRRGTTRPPFGLADERCTHRQANPGCRRAPRRGHCRQPSDRRRCSGQPPRAVRPCSTATPSHTEHARRGWSTARAGSMSSSAQAIGS